MSRDPISDSTPSLQHLNTDSAVPSNLVTMASDQTAVLVPPKRANTDYPVRYPTHYEVQLLC